MKGEKGFTLQIKKGIKHTHTCSFGDYIIADKLTKDLVFCEVALFKDKALGGGVNKH